ncbi:MAG: hypothetical protein CMM25_06145 [Rhodospirillaceae bacterium]|nr:hypothetical protein [Rhodospirillaceae bacterium]|tara:strand:- start:431 stop:2089 length:1659 start_codon:yes stop_codon:yes gene_type:complete
MLPKLQYNRHTLTAIIILAVTYIIYSFTAQYIINNSRTWLDEVTYLIKSFNYVSGATQPYSDQDPTWYMPIYFYELGVWQYLFGKEISTARLLSTLIGAASGLVLYDVVRRITGNSVAAALSTLVFLTNPSINFYFSTAIPASSVSFFLITAVWLIVTVNENPKGVTSLVFGCVLAIMYFYRQNMILATIALLPIYLLKIKKNHCQELAKIVLGSIVVIIITLLLFPDRLFVYAARLPLITPILAELGLGSNSLHIIENGTTSALNLSIPISRISLLDILDGFILPYSGLLLAVICSIYLSKNKLKVLRVIPAVFLFLSFTHYIGSLGYCPTCILPYTSYYAVIAVICFGVCIAILSQKNKSDPIKKFIIILSLTISVITMNYTLTGLASRTEYKFYPIAMFKNERPISEEAETIQLASFIKKYTDPNDTILPIHNLVTIPYAIFLAERNFPTQGINLRHSYRTIKNNLSTVEKERVVHALQSEGLWSDEVLEVWLTKNYNTIIFQRDPRSPSGKLQKRIERDFVRSATTGFRGYNVHIYRRLHNPDHNIIK